MNIKMPYTLALALTESQVAMAAGTFNSIFFCMIRGQPE
jgi:hypothetical protein